ncbi:MAG: isoleucine--tRNA ligase [Candidatus Saccharibacteria bacterium]|nr:isoleucine--tRNA ligase [Candidatus Saccharibacteria bacterium]
MKFKAGTRRRALEYEKDIAKLWVKKQTFQKSVDQRPKSNSFVFYDGPPFLTGKPHHGHLLISAIKDAVARYQTMQGKRVERRWGWDCHGLPAELFVEKELGITSKKEIGSKISISDYVNACRAAMVKTGTEWEDTIERVGRWVEFKGAYKTMDPEYMESVWWAFKKLYEDGKIYETEKILVYCTKDATPISKSEVAMENSYQLDTDPSVFVYFKLEDSDENLLAWTTTPWTLPANVAIAINPKLEYSLVKHMDKKIYIASAAVEKVMTNEKHQPLEYSVIKKVTGADLVGKKYHPLFENHGPQAHRVLAADFVTAEDGTGIVHEAPAYGEEDYTLCKQENVPIISIVDENGNYTQGRWQSQNIWDVNKEIAKTLVAENMALKVTYIQHEYPHCHRCGTKLMYRAHPSWFMDIQGQKNEMLSANDKTNWVPGHLKEGRFRNIIDSAPDWNLSRDRYWATPIPVWRGTREDGSEVIKVVGSYAEFHELTGKKLTDFHLPNVMNVTMNIDGVELHHIGKVLDCWFESGSMPFAQFHYPFENKDVFEASFPADFIVEAIDQTRGWFYSLTAVNVGLFGKSPFKNVICTGFINAADGKKMSKKLKNYTDPLELMDKYSADSFRFLLLSSSVVNGEDFNLTDKDVGDVARKLSMVWNMYDFFTMYAAVDGWESPQSFDDPLDTLENPLDRWIVSRVHQLSIEVSASMNEYDIPNSVKPILEFIDDASNWYVRRSRKRFWKSDNTDDKNHAYKTLHYILIQLATILAPFTPFMSEELYIKLTGNESVHLLDWSGKRSVDEKLIDEMSQLREAINKGLSERASAGIKVRQPLRRVTIKYPFAKNLEKFEEIICDELNVKEALFTIVQQENGTHHDDVSVVLDTKINTELKQEGLIREVIRQVQNARKKADLQVDDRIKLSLSSSEALLKDAMEKLGKIVAEETLATQIDLKHIEYTHSSEVQVEGMKLIISLER